MARKTVKFYRACKIERSLGDLKADFWKMNVITASSRKHRQKSRTFCSRIHWSAEYVILQCDKNKMAARTSKRSRERQVPYKILNDLSSVDLLYE